ncbi:serine hydrolase [Desulfosarcina sp.]|uniref:serine hydrolase n=1 Tax=Desulfosarcina sp. TaxID=2027861 RepID=UPI0035643003
MHRILKYVLFGILLSALMSPSAFAGVDWPLPYDRREKPVKSLYTLVDEELEDGLKKAVNTNSRWRSLIRKKKMALGVVDIGNPEAVRFARINGSVMMYAASLPKIAVLLASAQALEEGRIKETPAVLADMRKMISHSDNPAATRMIDRLGFDYIEKVLTAPTYRLYNTERGGGLWVGKRYASAGERHPEQLKGLSHAATATQVCRFYYLLSMGKLVNPYRSRQMLDILADPALHHKFVGVLDKRAPDATMFRKSGTWRDWHADSVLVWGPAWRRYIAVALVEDPDGETIMRDLIAVIDRLLEREHQRKSVRGLADITTPDPGVDGRRLAVLVTAAVATEDVQPGLND